MATNPQPVADTPPPRPKSLWRNRDYLLLWSGQAISSAGTEATNFALPLLILALTHSPAQAGLAAALRSLGYLVLGLPAGALVDRWNRKRTMIVCDAARALALGSIPIALALGRLSMPQIYLVALVEGLLSVFFGLAESAALPRVVATSQLPAATAQNEVTGSLSMLVGQLHRHHQRQHRAARRQRRLRKRAIAVVRVLGERLPAHRPHQSAHRHLQRLPVRLRLLRGQELADGHHPEHDDQGHRELLALH